MKKLLALIGLFAIAVLPSSGQNFHSLAALNCITLTVSNTAGYTNLAQYFGQASTATTNAQFLQYTNTVGTYVIDYTSNTNTGITSLSNGVVVYTNDQTQLTKDMLLHADGLGNVCSNYTLCVAGTGNATSTNSQLTFVPLLKGGNATQGANVGIIPPVLGTVGAGTILDGTNAFTITFNTTVSANGAWTLNTNLVSILPSKISLAGLRGLRLLTAANTNANGQTTFWDISLNTFVGSTLQ